METRKNPEDINLKYFDIRNLDHSATLIHQISEELFCLVKSEKLYFYKLIFNNGNISMKFYSKSVDLKPILFPDDNESDIILDINYMKTVRENCLFLSTFQNKKDEQEPAVNYLNTNVFIQLSPEDENDLKITSFPDTFYPNDEYENIKNLPQLEASESLYDK